MITTTQQPKPGPPATTSERFTNVLLIVNPESRTGRQRLRAVVMEVATALADIPDAPPLGIVALATANILVHDVEASSVLVANFGTVLGNPLPFGDGIEHQDGILDVCVNSPGTHADAIRIFWRMLRGGLANDRHVRILRRRNTRVDANPPRPAQADGDLIGHTTVDVCVTPRAVRVHVTRAAPRPWRLPRLTIARVRPELLATGTSS